MFSLDVCTCATQDIEVVCTCATGDMEVVCVVHDKSCRTQVIYTCRTQVMYTGPPAIQDIEAVCTCWTRDVEVVCTCASTRHVHRTRCDMRTWRYLGVSIYQSRCCASGSVTCHTRGDKRACLCLSIYQSRCCASGVHAGERGVSKRGRGGCSVLLLLLMRVECSCSSKRSWFPQKSLMFPRKSPMSWLVWNTMTHHHDTRTWHKRMTQQDPRPDLHSTWKALMSLYSMKHTHEFVLNERHSEFVLKLKRCHVFASDLSWVSVWLFVSFCLTCHEFVLWGSRIFLLSLFLACTFECVMYKEYEE